MLTAVPDTTVSPADETRRTRWGWVVPMVLILFLAGSIRLALTPLKQAALPNARFLPRQGAGHNYFVARAAEANAAVLEFVDEVDAKG